MEVVERISKTLDGHRPLATTDSSPKSVDPEEIASQEAQKAAALSVSMEGTWGNGVGVLLNVKGVGGGGGGTDGTKSVEAETTTRRTTAELEKEGLEDSEMNGVSSLLKMRASAREPVQEIGTVNWDKDQEVGDDEPTSGIDGVLYDVQIHGEDGGVMEGSDGGDLQPQMSEDVGEESDDVGEGYKFSVGDFVWGKIKSHPWWPGRVYDPSHASDFAVKKRQRNRLLVAYFGDNSFAWCHSSQLKPFAENFGDFSKLSHSRNFLTAIEEAADQIERLVVLDLTCSCVREHAGTALEWPRASSAGIKEGLFVPSGGTGLQEPAKVIAKLKLFAESVSNSTLLDCIMLKGWLSAFYGSKGFPNLPTYHQSVPIPGLEDPDETLVVDMSNYRECAHAPNQGPVEDQLFHPSEGTSQPSSENRENVLDNGFHQSRKQKSIVEILEVAKYAQIGRKRSTARKGANLNKLAAAAASTRSSKRKGNDGTSGNDDQTSGSTKTVSKRTKPSGTVWGMRTLTSDSGSDGNSIKKESVKASSKRKCKGVGLDDESARENFSSSSMLTNEKMEMLFGSNAVGGGGGDDDDDENRKQIEETYSPRERKKSKYLSPPYTTSNARQKKWDIDLVCPETQLVERKTEAAGNLLGSPQFLKQCNSLKRKQPEKLVTQQGAGSESSHRTPKECQSFMIDPVKVDDPAYEVISGIRSAATKPQFSKNFSNGSTGVFLSVFRNSVYHDGCYYKVYTKNESHRDLTSLKSEADATKREQDEAANDATSESKSQQANFRNNREAKSSKRKGKQVARTASKQTVGQVLKRHKTKNTAKTPSKSSSEDASAAVLFMSFGPGTSLPSKDDLIRQFSNYGPLNVHYTDIFVSNNCARIVFIRSSDAEKAFNESQMVSPFGASNITLQLRYLTASYDLRELKDFPTGEAGSVPNKRIKIAENTSGTEYVRQKLEMLTAMVGSSGEKMPPGTKSKLQVELKSLLEKVSAIAAA